MALIPSPAARYITVHHTQRLSSSLHRVYFRPEDCSGLSAEHHGAHIKLFFPDQISHRPLLPSRNAQGKIIWPEGKKPVTRTYTVRQFLAEEQLLAIDFVLHPTFGIAADWARHAQPGHVLGLAGPGGQARFHPNAEYWILIGDLSALAMIAATLEQLPTDAKGQVWLEINTPHEQIDLLHPTGVEVHWQITNADFNEKIKTSLQQLNWDTQQISVTLAGENARVIALRKIFRQQYHVPKSYLYAVPYWKQGETEENYHQQRHHVMDTDD